MNGLRRLMRPQHLSHFTIEGWHCFRAIAPSLGVAIRLEAHSFAIVAMPPLDGPRLSEASCSSMQAGRQTPRMLHLAMHAFGTAKGFAFLTASNQLK